MKAAWPAAALAAWVPAVALGCPACARDFNNTATYVLVASIIALPYVVSMVVLRAFHRVQVEDPVNAADPQPSTER